MCCMTGLPKERKSAWENSSFNFVRDLARHNNNLSPFLLLTIHAGPFCFLVWQVVVSRGRGVGLIGQDVCTEETNGIPSLSRL